MLNIPILGMVENMSHHVCKNCGHKEHTFGEGGVRRAAVDYDVEVLGEVSENNSSSHILMWVTILPVVKMARETCDEYTFSLLVHVLGAFGHRHLQEI